MVTPPREVHVVRVTGSGSSNVMTICEIMIYRQAECTVGSYSVNCSKPCHCLEGPCDSVTGSCMNAVCKDGWRGIACNETCNPGTFGASCSSTCHCHNNETCNHTDGTCPNNQCATGWTHDNCSVECDQGHFGVNCSSPCHCQQGANCDRVSGRCSDGQCAPGWTHKNFCVACVQYHFGRNCSLPCHCQHGANCDHVSGHCSDGQCAPGWTYSNCSVACDQDHFGKNCSSPCHCQHGANCDHVSGHCSDGQCAPGWTYSNCSVACKQGSYGQGCSMDCHCDLCHHVDGSCLTSAQCHDGYRMENGFCKPQQKISDSSALAGIIGGCVAALVVVVIGVAVVILYIKRRKPQSSKNGHTETTKPVLAASSSKKDFSNINQPKDNKHVCVDDKQKVEANDVSTVLSGTANNTLVDDSDYYSFNSVVPGIKIHDIWDYIHEKIQSGSTFFEDEFKKLRTGLIHKHEVAASEHNKGKNRYKGMYAYDHSRVPLTKDSDNDCEYINASFIHGFGKIKKFIASQGATEKMIDDFWRMIWQQKVDKIVMLTNLIEIGTLKCLQYWPDELNGICKYGRVDVKYVAIEETYDYNIRTLQITIGGDIRAVKQFHFKSWPDKDVPDTAWCLVDFWRAVDTRDSHHSPIVVHCSAGVGRTGTFIALDNLISQAKHEKCVRPFQMVEALREQRVSMVQTKEQYAYLHEALAEALLMGTHHVLTRQFESVHNYMMGKDNDSTISRWEQQFEFTRKSVANRPDQLQSVASQEAEYGNIGTVVSEIDAYRPQQQKTGGQPTEIQFPTVNAHKSLLVLSTPTAQQRVMFWSSLEQLPTSTLIDITSDALTMKSLLEGEIDGGSVSKNIIYVTKESQQNGFVEITYSVREKAQEQRSCDRTIKHFVFTSWKNGMEIPSDKKSLLDLIEAVHNWQPEMVDDKPIVILDNPGFQKCGVVAVLLNEIYRIIEQNGKINILESVKTMAQGNILPTHSKEQLKFCYDVILDYVQQQAVYQNY